MRTSPRGIDAGAEAVQIFESFGSALPPALFDRLSLHPIGRMVAGLKAARPQAKAIVFVRGGGANLHRFAAAGIGDALALDWTLDPAVVLPTLPGTVATQGNLDPLALIAGGAPLKEAVTRILDAFSARPHIFNLGHGIQQDTPLAHVEELMALVKGGT